MTSAQIGTIHLIHGYLAAGKTTFARRLADRVGGICLSIDEWYLRLYTDGNPTSHLDDELQRRLREQLDSLWPHLVRRGLDVVLDFGFWSRSDRDDARQRAAELGTDVVLYSLLCDDRIARARLAARNDNPAGSFLLHGQAYEDLRWKFEPLDADEQHQVVSTGAHAGAPPDDARSKTDPSRTEGSGD